MKLLFVVQGLFEKSDSIGYDCFYQYMLLKSHFGNSVDVGLFAETSDPARYPLATIQPIADLFSYEDDPDAVVIYHFCDGWTEIEALLERFAGRVIVRWHNNTPPWFYSLHSPRSVARTLAGFRTIQKLGRSGKFMFMCNSNFTRNQLKVLGVSQGLLPVVYPASRYLDGRDNQPKHPGNRLAEHKSLHLLFVGRLVAHKGHRHILLTAHELMKMTGKPVTVSFPGRADDSARGYEKELRELAAVLQVDLRIPGEVDAEELEALYQECSAFVCISEHEGFGLPVYEAMARDVPTLVWANTAFTEILHDHPLAFSRLDYIAFANAINSLRYPELYNSVIRYQRQYVLPDYTKEVVLTQLLRSISADRTADGDLIGITEAERLAHQIPFEIFNNYVTQYDISSYAAMTDESRIGRWESQLLSPSLFSGPKGPITASVYRSKPISGVHIIFGPFLDLPPGSYRLIFDVTYRASKVAAGAGFRFDVFAERSLAFEKMPAAVLAIADGCMLEFTLQASVRRLEFRIEPYGFPGPESGELAFWGVRLADASARPRGSRHYKEDAEFVSSCYQQLLGRAADGRGLGSYLLRLMNGSMSREEVVAEIMSSEEARARNKQNTEAASQSDRVAAERHQPPDEGAGEDNKLGHALIN